MRARTATEGDRPVDLAALARTGQPAGPIWSRQSEDLSLNLVVFAAGNGVAEHVNAEVDVLLVGVAGEGVVEVDGRALPLPPGHALLVAKGARRATRAVAGHFAYLTCHRRRDGLVPSVGRRAGGR